MPEANQLSVMRDDVHVTAADLVQVHEGTRTEEGLRENIRVGVQYIEAWLRGRGAVPIYNLMEDAATAEISRAQVWQWIHLKAKLDDGREVTPAMFRDALGGEMERVKGEVGAKAFEGGRFPEAIKLFSDYNLMEDAATAEISRAQVWQWIHLKAKLDDGREVTAAMFRDALAGEMERVKGEVGARAFEGGRFPEAIKLFSDMSLADTFEEFLTLPAYRLID